MTKPSGSDKPAMVELVALSQQTLIQQGLRDKGPTSPSRLGLGPSTKSRGASIKPRTCACHTTTTFKEPAKSVTSQTLEPTKQDLPGCEAPTSARPSPQAASTEPDTSWLAECVSSCVSLHSSRPLSQPGRLFLLCFCSPSRSHLFR